MKVAQPSYLGPAYRTARHATIRQMIIRIRRRLVQNVAARWTGVLNIARPLNGGPYGPTPGWPVWPDKARRMGSEATHVEDIDSGTWRLLGTRRNLGWPPDWMPRHLATLGIYQLHYFDWAWSLFGPQGRFPQQRFLGALEDWATACKPGESPAWDPYPTALRSWNLCALDARLGLAASAPWVRGLLDTHRRFLSMTLEHDLRGNHLIAELKALVGLGVCMGHTPTVTNSLDRLRDELGRQVLADGGHEERSPAYHARVMADLEDLRVLLENAGVPIPRALRLARSMMGDWLTSVLTPAGTLPVFNDGDQIGPGSLSQLPESSALRRVEHLAASGFVILRPEPNVYIAIDVGGPGPRQQPGHAHAGAGSFEMWVDGQLTFRNTGSSTYEPGERRTFERSTAAQNTLTVNRQDQAEMWGAFRVGRRPAVRSYVRRNPHLSVRVGHDGFRGKEGIGWHWRTFNVGAKELAIHDRVEGSARGIIHSHLHSPRHDVHISSAGVVTLGPVQVTALAENATQPISVEACSLAAGLGTVRAGTKLTLEQTATLPVQLSTRITWA